MKHFLNFSLLTFLLIVTDMSFNKKRACGVQNYKPDIFDEFFLTIFNLKAHFTCFRNNNEFPSKG